MALGEGEKAIYDTELPKFPFRNKQVFGLKIPENAYDPRGIRTFTGEVYEALQFSMFGGRSQQHFYFSEFLPKKSKSFSSNLDLFDQQDTLIEESPEMTEFIPDLTDTLESFARDAKSTEYSDAFKSNDYSVLKYLAYQLMSQKKGLSLHDPEVYLDIFRHKVKNSSRIATEKGLEVLAQKLAKNTHSMISLPLSILVAAHGNTNLESNGNPLKNRYYSEHGWKITKIHSSTLTDFSTNPEEGISKFGLNPEDYKTERYVLSPRVTLKTTRNGFFGKTNLKRKLVTPFPILLVKDKNHEDWIKQLKDSVDFFHRRDLDCFSEESRNLPIIGPLFCLNGFNYNLEQTLKMVQEDPDYRNHGEEPPF